MLVMPFNKTDAFKLGIIDKDGKVLKKLWQLKTAQEKNAYTILNRLVFRVKRIINKIPLANKQFASLTAAMALIRECYEKNEEPLDLERLFLEELECEHDSSMVEEYVTQYKKSFRYFVEDGGAVAANNAAATPGVAGLERDVPNIPVSPKNIFKRKKLPVIKTG